MATVKRLIDANALYINLGKLAREPDYQHEDEIWSVGVAMAMGEVWSAPTVDAVEVVHGRWIPTYHTYYNRYGEHQIADEWHCSECQIYSRDEWNYCPNCCARMDLEVKDA